ncbi:NAD(P)-binding protein [Methanococcus aeolicus]|uniref:NAD(P)-binding protein n=1 Tax=Methanococcus aeolicus TaxID=42879 RepID=UPI0021C97A01|nr:NAD(P)-binding protein [Methanococcus aeolicus]UXM84617.1 NAD(P)-binding protein [Methanococcus aeolicus]
MKIGIVGAGLGGLLAGAILSKNYDITIYEKLPIVGGRFTNIPYKGYQLTTGALHMVPHGADGYLAQLIKKAGCNVNIINSAVDGYFKIKGKDRTYKELFGIVGFKDKLKALKLMADLKMGKFDDNASFGELLKDIPYAYEVGNSFTGWALSLTADDTPISEVKEIAKHYKKFGGPGMIVGGCSAIINELVKVIKKNNGKIITNYNVKNITIENNKGYIDSNEFDIVISNLSPTITEKISNVDIINNGNNNGKKPIPSKGIKIAIGSKEKLINHNTIVFTPECERINGFNCPSNVDKNLAKEGHNLIMVHGIQITNNVKKEIDIMLNDIENIYSEKNINYEIIHIQSYRDDMPVNHASNGTDLNPIVNDRLYLVGDGVKGKGGIEVEGVALSVMKVMDSINNINK